MNTLTVFPKRNGFAPLSFNQIFNEFLNDGFFNEADFKASTPLVNIKESNSGYHLEVAAPGMNKENFDMAIEKKLLTISAEKQTEQKKDDEKFTRKEFSYTNFKRSFTLPENIDTNNIKAVYEHGILKVDLLKKEAAKNVVQKISVN